MLATTNQGSAAIERVLIQGDLSQLSESDRLNYYQAVCNSLGLNPLTKPFEMVRLQGKLVFYARKDCCDQLRRLHNISLDPPQTQVVNDTFVVSVTAHTPEGRADTDLGAVCIKGLSGDALCNAMLKSITKAKRRVTLSICGLGILDQTEVETIPEAVLEPVVQPEVWRSWKSPEDAIAWAAAQLPDRSVAELWELFDQLLAVKGKKAPQWVERILQLAAAS